MKMWKNIVIFGILVLGLAVAGYSWYLRSLSPCDRTIQYSIGRFDPQFGISESQFKADLTQAESVWEKSLGRDVFTYNPSAPFKVNLIYDERQIETVQKQRTESGLSVVESAFKQLDSNFNALKKQYDQKVAAYQTTLKSYNDRKAAYEKQVAYWNERGGAPKSQFDTLESERQYLNTAAANLNQETQNLNKLSQQLNDLLSERNTKAAEYNQAAAEYNQKYKQGFEFDQAEYNGKEINVYQFGNQNDLVLALSHEFGHALGMNHVENPESIMYYLTGLNVSSNPSPTPEDIAELNQVCKR